MNSAGNSAVDLDTYTLRAPGIVINVGLIARLEVIIGSDALRQIERRGEANITIAQKRSLMIEILGYGDEEADNASVAVLEAEMYTFFLLWDMQCRTGKLYSERSQLTALKSSLLTADLVSPSPTSSHQEERSNS